MELNRFIEQHKVVDRLHESMGLVKAIPSANSKPCENYIECEMIAPENCDNGMCRKCGQKDYDECQVVQHQNSYNGEENLMTMIEAAIERVLTTARTTQTLCMKVDPMKK